MKHLMTDINLENKMGVCAVDGLVKVYKNSKGSWSCYQKKRENQKKHEQRWALESRYGKGAYEKKVQFLESQNNCCALCQKPVTMTTGNLDHCHLTGRIRGVLCRQCNIGLSYFNDNPELLMSASKYVVDCS